MIGIKNKWEKNKNNQLLIFFEQFIIVLTFINLVVVERKQI